VSVVRGPFKSIHQTLAYLRGLQNGSEAAEGELNRGLAGGETVVTKRWVTNAGDG
jgi:hypothetical protein